MDLISIIFLTPILAIPASLGWIPAAFVLWKIRRQKGEVDGVIAILVLSITALSVTTIVGAMLGGWPPPRGYWAGAGLSAVAGSAVVSMLVKTSSSRVSSRDGASRPVVAGFLGSVAMAYVYLLVGMLVNPPGV